MSRTTTKVASNIRAAAVVLAGSTLLVACGGGGGAADSDPTPTVVEVTISAAPAFLDRSCDSRNSPQLFCPIPNGS